MKKTKFLFLFIILALTSCTTVEFENPQPISSAEIKEFPIDLQGEYTSSYNDTLIISKDSFDFGTKNSLFRNIQKSLSSKEAILKKENKYFVLNLKNEKYWEVVLMKQDGNYLKIYYIDLSKKDKENLIINKLKKNYTVKEVLNKDNNVDFYLVNPSQSEFKKMLGDDIFQEVGTFKKVK